MLDAETKIRIIENTLMIDNKQGQVVPFKLNKLQRHFMTSKANRNIILKHRQGGGSAIILADMFTDDLLIPYMSCVVISHETKSTQRLLDRVQMYYDTMDEPKPHFDASSRSEKRIDEMHSSIYIGTAGARAFGHGDTIKKAHLSELSLYEDASRILNGVQDAVPLTGELTIECTPNGEDNIFFEQWTRARTGKSPYKAFFYPWWWSEDYQIPQDSPLCMPEDRGEIVLTGEELAVKESYKRYIVGFPGLFPPDLSNNQMRWRRWKIAEKQGLFWQEYPEDEVSCFITIGDPVFDVLRLNELAQSCYQGDIHDRGWTYWIKPQPNAKYLIGADSAAGAPTGSYSTAVVMDASYQVCATFQARLDPNMFAAILKDLAIWYNSAELVIERNFTGYAVIGQLQSLGYNRLYYQRDFLTGKITDHPGWWTNDNTKQFMMTKMKDRIGIIKTWDINLVRQLRSYRYIKYKPTAQSFDDLAIAAMIVNAVKAIGGGAKYMGAVPGYSW